MIRADGPNSCHLIEVAVAERASILRRYVQQVPGARPHVPVDRHAPVSAFEAIAGQYPAFRVEFDHAGSP